MALPSASRFGSAMPSFSATLLLTRTLSLPSSIRKKSSLVSPHMRPSGESTVPDVSTVKGLEGSCGLSVHGWMTEGSNANMPRFSGGEVARRFRTMENARSPADIVWCRAGSGSDPTKSHAALYTPSLACVVYEETRWLRRRNANACARPCGHHKCSLHAPRIGPRILWQFIVLPAAARGPHAESRRCAQGVCLSLGKMTAYVWHLAEDQRGPSLREPGVDEPMKRHIQCRGIS